MARWRANAGSLRSIVPEPSGPNRSCRGGSSPGPSIGSALSRSSTSRVTFELHGMRPGTRSGADRRRSRTAVVSVESGTGMSGRVDRSVTETTDRPGGGFELLDLFGKTAYLHRIEAHSEPTWSRDCRIVFEFDLFE